MNQKLITFIFLLCGILVGLFTLTFFRINSRQTVQKTSSLLVPTSIPTPHKLEDSTTISDIELVKNGSEIVHDYIYPIQVRCPEFKDWTYFMDGGDYAKKYDRLPSGERELITGLTREQKLAYSLSLKKRRQEYSEQPDMIWECNKVESGYRNYYAVQDRKTYPNWNIRVEIVPTFVPPIKGDEIILSNGQKGSYSIKVRDEAPIETSIIVEFSGNDKERDVLYSIVATFEGTKEKFPKLYASLDKEVRSMAKSVIFNTQYPSTPFIDE